MYLEHFNLAERPFSITPDPRFLYMSARHREALAHLLYGLGEGGGFVQLTGEVGTGKTTLCRCLMEQLPGNVDIAVVLNPKLTAEELIATLCDELGVEYPHQVHSIKVLTDALNRYLLDAHARGRRTVLIIDEAQNLSADVLEQIRLLTNLETSTQKLLQIILVGQPELRDMLAREEMRQLAQRVTARYHLEPISREDSSVYIQHRLQVCGTSHRIFNREAVDLIQRLSGGIPRLINVLCDRSMLGAYVEGKSHVDNKIVKRAAKEILADPAQEVHDRRWFPLVMSGLVAAALIGVVVFYQPWQGLDIRTALFGKQEAHSVDRVQPPGPLLAATDEPEPVSQHPPSGRLPVKSGAEDPVSEYPSGWLPVKSGAEDPVSEHPSGQLPVKTGAEDPVQEHPSGQLPVKTGAEDPVPEQPVTETESAVATVAVAHVGPDLPAGPPVLNEDSLASLLLTADRTWSRRAWSALFTQWDIELSPGVNPDYCNFATAKGLRCLQENGDWSDLRSFDRPVILNLEDTDALRVPVVLQHLDDDEAELIIAGERYRIPAEQIEPFWQGDFILLLKMPPDRTMRMELGGEGPDVVWLRQQINSIQGVDLQTDRPLYFDYRLFKHVLSFQRNHGLTADGVVGKYTVIQLNSQSQRPGIPRLAAARP
jgi:general secretion pathway protein A